MRSIGKTRFFNSTLLFLITTIGAVLLASPAMAQVIEGVACIEEQPAYTKGTLGCNASDVQLSSPFVTVVDPCDFPGDTATLQVLFDLTTNTTRNDIAVWFSIDGDPNGDGPATGENATSCTVAGLPSNLLLNTSGVPTTQTNFDTDFDGDACGDASTGGENGDNEVSVLEPQILQANLGTFDLVCNDTDGDGKLDVPVVISWKNQSNNDCASAIEAVPQTSAKCASDASLQLDVPIPGQIIVQKSTSPQPDSTSFGFTLDGSPSGIPGGYDGAPYNFLLAHGEGWDSGNAIDFPFNGGLPAGAYSVVETPNVLYNSSGSCTSSLGAGINTDPSNINLSAGEILTCGFNNSLIVPGTFTVNKNFSDNNVASVSIALTCTEGTPAVSPLDASEASPAIFTVNGSNPATTCTATESGTPAGYTENNSDCQDNDLIDGSCTMVNTLNSDSFTVNKDFSDDNGTSVSIALTCTTGTPAVSPIFASEASPAIFTVNGFTPGATCTATESGTPAGYTENNSDCQDNDLIGGSCTMVNTLNSDSFTVNKDFSDDNVASVSIALTCTTGTPAVSPLDASEGSAAIFTVNGFTPGATCTATESGTPAGYTENNSDCQDNDLIGGSCTMVNTLNSDSFTVNKDFSDDNVASVSIALTCTTGTPAVSPLDASEASPAIFTVNGFTPGATCTATESGTPAGYTENNSDCQDNDPIGGNCTMVNTLNSDSFTVNKDFSDDNVASVSIALTCTTGTPAVSPLDASEASPAVFTVNGTIPATTCTATESGTPAGYTENNSDCQDNDPIGGNCTMVNTLIPPPVIIVEDIPIPTSSIWALLLLILSVLGTGLYFRRERS